VLEVEGQLSRPTRAKPDDEFAADSDAESLEADGEQINNGEEAPTRPRAGIPRLAPCAGSAHCAAAASRTREQPYP
jgi:hypothetical protein